MNKPGIVPKVHRLPNLGMFKLLNLGNMFYHGLISSIGLPRALVLNIRDGYCIGLRVKLLGDFTEVEKKSIRS